MIISLISAWLATLSAFFTGIKICVKKNKKLNLIFHKIHKPLGITLIAAGIIHGLFAGNMPGTSLSEASYGGLLFTFNMGTVSFVISILLALTYVFRKYLKRKWMICHRVLTLLLTITVVIHIFQMGITLPQALASKTGSVESATGIFEEEHASANEAETSENSQNTESTEFTESAEGSDNTESAGSEEVSEIVEAAKNTEGTEKSESAEGLVTFSGATLKDGTYEGSASGFNGDITVSVTVNNGAVTDITILSENDTPNFFSRAKEIVNNILDSQSLEVEAVSGATYSSKGIRDAVYDALQDAVESGELTISEIQVSGGHGGPGHGKR